MRTPQRFSDLLLTSGIGLCALLSLPTSAQFQVTVAGSVAPCTGALYPVHIQSSSGALIDTTIYTDANCQYNFVFSTNSQGTVSVETTCDGGITWVSASGTWAPFLSYVFIPLYCNGGSGPSNDECGMWASIAAGTSCVPTSGDLSGATQSQDPINCGGFVSSTANDVWYGFLATGTTTTVMATGDGDVDIVLEVFTDSCSSPASIGCADDTFDGGSEEFIFATTPGQYYFYRIYDWATPPSVSTSFTTCVVSDNSLFDCEGAVGGAAMPGTPCDDGNPSTSGDTWNANCVCTGNFIPPCQACFTMATPQPWTIEYTNCSSGGTGPFAYSWQFSNGATSGLSNPTETVSTSGPGITCLTLEDALGCISMVCDSFYINPDGYLDNGALFCQACIDAVPATNGPLGQPIPWTVDAMNCSSGGTGNATFTIDWGDGVTNGPNPHVYNSPGTYTVCITMSDTSGCTSTACDQVTIDGDGTVDPAVPLPCEAGFWVMQAYEADSLNPGTAVPIPNLLWIWNLSTTGNATANLNLSTTLGTSVATVVGCNAALVGAQVTGPNFPGGTTVIAVDCPNVWLSQNAIATGTSVHTFTGNTGNVQFLWSWGDGTPNSTEPYPSHVYANGGPYLLCLTITDISGCTDTACDSVSVDGNGFYTGMATNPEANGNGARNGFTVNVLNELPATGINDRPAVENTLAWPNPVEDVLNLRFNTTLTGNLPMTIIDMNGRAVRSEQVMISAGGNNLQVPVSDLAPGLYMMRFGNDAKAVAFRFVKR